MQDVMRVDRGDRCDVILLTGANGDAGGRRSSIHPCFRISTPSLAYATRRFLCHGTSLAVCDPRSLATALSTRVSFHARGSVSRTTAAPSSIDGGRPIASLNSPYRTGDNAPAPMVPV